MEKPQVLIIEDDVDFCELLAEVLSQKFDCILTHSGEQGLEKIQISNTPLVILIDITLPDMNGFEVCEKIEKGKNNKNHAIFIISGDDKLETKLKAFELGADDFLVKPFEIDELLSRVLRIKHLLESNQQIIENSEASQQLATAAMAQASQYGFVMSFFKSLNSCSSMEQLVRLFFEAMTHFGLHASLMIKAAENTYYDAALRDITPIEKNIFSVLLDKGRLYEFSSRMMVNGEQSSFLIKNMPEDATQAGEVRDFLAALLEGLDAKISDINVNTAFLSAISKLSGTISSVKTGPTSTICWGFREDGSCY